MFGPEPRDYSFKLNKKVKKLAKKSVLSAKAKDKQIKVLEDFQLEAPKTKEFVSILSNLSVSGKTILVVGNEDKNIYLSSRNLKKAKVATVSELNTYDIINADQLILSESSIEQITKGLN